MKNSQELETFILSIQGYSHAGFVDACANIIESIEDLDLRRQLAEHVLYHMSREGIASSNPNFRKISNSIESSAGDKFAKRFKSLIGFKDEVDDSKKPIQKLFREYTPHRYDLTMLAARVMRHTGIAAEPVSSPAATSGGAEVVAKAEMLTYEQILDKIRPFNESSNISARELSELKTIVSEFNKMHPSANPQIEELKAQIDLLTAIHASKLEASSYERMYRTIPPSGSPKPLSNKLLFAQTQYDSLHSSKDLRPTVGGAGADESIPLSPSTPSSPKRTSYADYFDGLRASIREYQELKSQDFTSLSGAEQIEIATKLSILENDALKVIEGEPGDAIEAIHNQEPKLNHLAHAKKVGEQLQRKGFPATRQVRGDGNCYFRSIIYSYLENALCADPESGQKLELIGKLKEKLENLIGRYGDDFDMDLNLLISKLGKIEANGDYSILDLQTDMLDSSPPSFDHLLVRAARALTAEAMIENKENIQSFLDHPFDEYIKDTLSMKKDADGPAIQGSYLGKSLGINIHLQDITADGQTQTIATDSINGEAYFNVHLLRDNTRNHRVERRRDSGVAHYFVLYDSAQKRKIDENLTSASKAPMPRR